MFLDDGDPTYSFVVGEGFVVHGHQANHLGIPALGKNVDPYVAVKKMETVRIYLVSHNYWRLYDPDFGY